MLDAVWNVRVQQVSESFRLFEQGLLRVGPFVLDLEKSHCPIVGK
jgi:hypothetical protein